MVRRVLDAGARGYVLKSDLATHLVKAVKDVCAGKMFLTPRVSDIVVRGFSRPGRNRTQQSILKPGQRPARLK